MTIYDEFTSEKGIFMFLSIYKIALRDKRTDAKFKNESKAILAILVALLSECTSVYHALGNRLRLSATRLERRLTWHAGVNCTAKLREFSEKLGYRNRESARPTIPALLNRPSYLTPAGCCASVLKDGS